MNSTRPNYYSGGTSSVTENISRSLGSVFATLNYSFLAYSYFWLFLKFSVQTTRGPSPKRINLLSTSLSLSHLFPPPPFVAFFVSWIPIQKGNQSFNRAVPGSGKLIPTMRSHRNAIASEKALHPENCMSGPQAHCDVIVTPQCKHDA